MKNLRIYIIFIISVLIQWRIVFIVEELLIGFCLVSFFKEIIERNKKRMNFFFFKIMRTIYTSFKLAFKSNVIIWPDGDEDLDLGIDKVETKVIDFFNGKYYAIAQTYINIENNMNILFDDIIWKKLSEIEEHISPIELAILKVWNIYLKNSNLILINNWYCFIIRKEFLENWVNEEDLC